MSEIKLDSELKAKWLQALRSGEYHQGNGLLCKRNPDNYNVYEHCCLGVLAEVSGVPRDHLLYADGDKECPVRHENLDSIRLNILGRWVGSIDSTWMPFIPTDPTTHFTIQQKLAGMNDSGKSFAEIADWIEANL